MLNKISKSIVVSLLLVVSAANAVDIIEGDGNKNTNNEIDDKYNEKYGWSFYFDEKAEKSVEKKVLDKKIKKAEMNILQKILDENKKQTELQEKILALLQKQIDPKPKEITVNGKKCTANSSAECFDYASLIIAEAKKVPVMQEFLSDPYDITKAAKYLQWQAKYFKHVINIGNSLQFAYAQFGEKAYPINAQSSQYTVGSGEYEGRMLPDAQSKLIISNKDKLSYSIFIGKNIVLDVYSALAIVDIVKKYGEMDIEIIFWDKKAQEVFNGAVESVYKVNMIKHWKNVHQSVNPQAFETFSVTTTPSYVVKLDNKGKKESQILLHGKVDMTSFRARNIAFLELKGLIDYKKFTEQEAWKSKKGKDVVKKYYLDESGVKINFNKEEK
jgi:hypothetical protein